MVSGLRNPDGATPLDRIAGVQALLGLEEPEQTGPTQKYPAESVR